MNTKILLGAALLGGFILFKNKKSKIAEPRKVDAITEKPIVLTTMKSLSPEVKKKVIEEIRAEKSFQKGKLFVLSISGAILITTSAVAYLIKLLIDNSIDISFQEDPSTAYRKLEGEINSVNQEITVEDIETIIENPIERQSFADKLNEGFENFKSKTLKGLDNIKMKWRNFRDSDISKIEKNINKISKHSDKIEFSKQVDFKEKLDKLRDDLENLKSLKSGEDYEKKKS